MNRTAVTVFSDKCLRACLVVKTAGRLWLVPNSPDGWTRRLPLAMTAKTRKERLTPAPAADLARLGIPTGDLTGKPILS